MIFLLRPPLPFPPSEDSPTPAVGAVFAVLVTSWLRTRTLARLEIVLKSRNRREWLYALAFWVVAILLGVSYNVLGLIPGRFGTGLTAGSTLVVLGVLWPPYMYEATLDRKSTRLNSSHLVI